MAYERYTEDDEQQPVRQWQPANQTQPVSPYRPGSVDPRDADPASGYGAGGVTNPAFDAPPQYQAGLARAQNSMREDGLSGAQQQSALSGLAALARPSGGGNPLGGPNTGVAGGGAATGGGLSPMAGGAMARYGTGNIAGAENMSRGNYMGQLEGFNTGAWDNAPDGYEANSIKNTFGKIASRYDVTQPGAVRSLMADPDFQRFFPEAQIIEHPNGDLIDFGDGKPVDVIRAAVAGGSGEGWQWGADDGTGGGGLDGGMGGMGGGMGMPDLQTILSGSDPLTDIIKRIEDLQGGGTPDAEQQALIQMIRGGEAI